MGEVNPPVEAQAAHAKPVHAKEVHGPFQLGAARSANVIAAGKMDRPTALAVIMCETPVRAATTPSRMLTTIQNEDMAASGDSVTAAFNRADFNEARMGRRALLKWC
jgi:hypothetical protein